ncbi:hypothetical protein BDM02DRAFT_2802209 [Thelephora ganbajun]|uniref:Uncharacterized protein n=1 Tax=Thelephora ganbajun TaxID=370292 RepID=A0ACB6ZCM3_THEGA|nr:hypothetical protein BDM02DRAFT_2802209 [Thelephora ganbajun]
MEDSRISVPLLSTQRSATAMILETRRIKAKSLACVLLLDYVKERPLVMSRHSAAPHPAPSQVEYPPRYTLNGSLPGTLGVAPGHSYSLLPFQHESRPPPSLSNPWASHTTKDAFDETLLDVPPSQWDLRVSSLSIAPDFPILPLEPNGLYYNSWTFSLVV